MLPDRLVSLVRYPDGLPLDVDPRELARRMAADLDRTEDTCRAAEWLAVFSKELDERLNVWSE